MVALASATAREKSPEAFRTISEVAVELDIPQHVLRFWESRFSQVRPIKRAGGRRYYRPEDVDLLKGIRALLYREGYTIKGAQKVMRDRGLRFVAELGRVSTVKSGAFSQATVIEVPDDQPRGARAMLAVVERAHEETFAVPVEDEAFVEELVVEEAEEADTAQSFATEERTKLEALLAELVQMKSRLRAAMPQRAG
ncbi:MAG TPA: MerR family transcriptional regulator [Rhizobiaceae bacterium]|nr:MerR family transcriptional regulator [Rhizobiaceae bacterium]